MDLKNDMGSFCQAQRRTFPGQMVLEAVDAPLGEYLAACFAGVLVSITGVLELRSSMEIV